MLDTDSKDLVTVHTDGNEQLSVMSYGPGMEITADSVSPLCIHFHCLFIQHSMYSCVGEIFVVGHLHLHIHFILFYSQ